MYFLIYFLLATLIAWTLIVYGTKEPPEQFSATSTSLAQQSQSVLMLNKAQLQQGPPHQTNVPENKNLPSPINVEKNRGAELIQFPQALPLTSFAINRSRSMLALIRSRNHILTAFDYSL